MLAKFHEILQSDTTWAVVALLLAYAANSVVSRGLLAKMAPTSPLRRAVRALHGFLDRVDPKVLILVLVLPIANGCIPKPVQAPTRLEVATMAVNWTDEALAAAIEAEPGKSWDASVAAVVAAADAVRAAGDVCDALPGLRLVAAEIECEKCYRAVASAKDALQCQN